MTLIGWLLLTLCFILVLLPPRWDPAIRLRERNLRATQRSPYLAKCKRLRTDGPTPCLCCPGKCVG